jgi:hypothetical protein
MLRAYSYLGNGIPRLLCQSVAASRKSDAASCDFINQLPRLFDRASCHRCSRTPRMHRIRQPRRCVGGEAVRSVRIRQWLHGAVVPRTVWPGSILLRVLSIDQPLPDWLATQTIAYQSNVFESWDVAPLAVMATLSMKLD